MKKSRFTESQIVKILAQQESGQKVADICREHGISQPTFYGWKRKYGATWAWSIQFIPLIFICT